MEIVGQQGVLRADDALNVERPITIELRRNHTTLDSETVSNHLAYARQVDEFASALEGKGTFPAPGEEGWQNQEILDAAFRSLKSGTVEEVPRIPQNA